MEKQTQKIKTGSGDMSMTNLTTSFFKSSELVCWEGLGKRAGEARSSVSELPDRDFRGQRE